MFKYLAKLMWWPDKFQDAEFDIENLPVVAVERDSEEQTCIGYLKEGIIEDWYISCTIEKHKEFVQRLHNKLKVHDL